MKTLFAVVLLLQGVPAMSRAAEKPKLAMIVIDVQKSFFEKAANPNLKTVMANTKQIFKQSAATNTPFYITYEESRDGDMDIPQELKSILPKDQNTYIKTSYGATGQPDFSKDLKESGATHVVVVGSETDVCVMQTVLGLREQGYEVMLQKDAVFSSDPNVSPALRRMEAAGVEMVDMGQVQKMMEGKQALGNIKGKTKALRLSPYKNGKANVGIVLSMPDEKELQALDECGKKEKLARLSQLILLTEWTQTPVYLAGKDAKKIDLPKSLLAQLSPKARAVLKKKHWKSLSELPKNQIEQVVVAGMNKDLDPVFEKLQGKQVYFMEDAVFSHKGSPDMAQGNQIPITYKSFYREMTYSVDIKEFPSKQWIAKDEEFYDVLETPEDLPAIPPECRHETAANVNAKPNVIPGRK